MTNISTLPIRNIASREDVQAILESRIISYAKTVNDDRSVTIVAVFECSNYHHFFFVFSAATKRTPRRGWKFLYQHHGIYSGQGAYYSLRSLLASRYPYSGKQWTVRHIHGARTLADLIRRISTLSTGYVAPTRFVINPARAGSYVR